MNVNSNFINGKWKSGHGTIINKIAPEDKSVIWRAHSADYDDVNEACESASNAFNYWSKINIEQRMGYINHYVTLLHKYKQQIATIISQETSKPLWETYIEVQSMIDKVLISKVSWEKRTGYGEIKISNKRILLHHKAHGVMAVFGPYNFPGHLPNGHIIPALIAGNTVVFKPSELTPATAEIITKIWQETNLPDGVLNLIQGDKKTGQMLLMNKNINGVLFTGSTKVGCYFHRYFAGQPEKILVLEMGGNNALIIDNFEDEYINYVVDLIIQSAFISAGQRCTCARRLLIKSGKKGDNLILNLIEKSKQLSIGHWNNQPQPFMGGVISHKHVDNMLQIQNNLQLLGGRILLQMKQIEKNATFLTPGIMETTNINLPDEEYFCPFIKITRYEHFDQAVDIANNTKYGLAVGLVSNDESLFNSLIIKSQAGIVNWNNALTGASSRMPFGGIKSSGNHRPSGYYAADYCAWPVVSLIN
ncbi:succinylglutamate-semialdehyde dehydrogenase [Candidatus Ishikawella capsulata]|nr:succinylglutamate-semialdehyde dehydrogenase [Candidatus Ishikawaella capsulata]